MSRARNAGILAAFFGFGLGALSCVSTHAHELDFGAIKIEHPWVAAVDSNAHQTTGYVIEIQNSGTEADRLTGASLNGVPGVLLEMADELFAVAAQGWEIKAGSFVRIQPGENQILFQEPKGPLKEGDMIKGTLVFERAGILQVEFMVEPASLAEEDRSNPPKAKHMHH